MQKKLQDLICVHNKLTCWSVRKQAQEKAADESDGDQRHRGARFSQTEMFANAVQGFI